jgi:hypothetical protein
MEYTDAYRLAASLPRNVVELKRGELARRIDRLEVFRGHVPEYLRAALRGYEDWLEFDAQHVVVVNGEQFAPGYTEEAARYEQETR